MPPNAKRWFQLAAAGSLAIAVLHAAVIVIGAPAYAYFGAAELVPLAARGSPIPALITGGLVVLLALCGAYALAAASSLRRLPLLRPVLIAIGVVYTLRGLPALPQVVLLLLDTPQLPIRAVVFSLGSLLIGLTHWAGLRTGWESLAAGRPESGRPSAPPA
jgi:hypothetical protein